MGVNGAKDYVKQKSQHCLFCHLLHARSRLWVVPRVPLLPFLHGWQRAVSCPAGPPSRVSHVPAVLGLLSWGRVKLGAVPGQQLWQCWWPCWNCQRACSSSNPEKPGPQCLWHKLGEYGGARGTSVPFLQGAPGQDSHSFPWFHHCSHAPVVQDAPW